MDNELKATEPSQTTNHNSPEGDELGESEANQARVTELESSLATKEEEFRQANARIIELEQALAKLDKKSTETDSTLAEAIASYRALVIKSNPDIIEELIAGGNIEEIDASLEKAQSLIVKVRKGLEEEATATRVPAGAPQRTAFDLSILSPREKIQYALGGKK